MIEYKKWDSDILDMKVGEVVNGKLYDDDNLSDYDYLYTKISPENNKDIQILYLNKFKLREISINFSIEIKNTLSFPIRDQ